MFWTTINAQLWKKNTALPIFILLLFVSISLRSQVWTAHADLASVNCNLDITVTSTILTCDGADVCVAVSGGVAPYTFTLDGEDVNDNPATTVNVCFQDLQPGVSLTVADAEGCTESITIEIPVVDYYLGAQVTDVSCHGGSDGAIQLEILIDLAPLFYSWEGPNGYSAELQDIEKIEHLQAGTYSVSVTTNEGYCVGLGSWTVGEPDPIELDIAITTQACGQPDVCVFVNGGTPPYQVWAFPQLPPSIAENPHGQIGALTDLNPANAIPLFQTASNAAFCASDVPNGTYYILALDANFCYTWEAVTIEANNTLDRTVTTSNVSCNGENDGSICFVIHSGTPPFSTTLSPATSNIAIAGPEGCFENLVPGQYVITSTDGNGCSVSEAVFIHGPGALSATFTITSPPCSDQVDGCLLVEGGTMPFQVYVWEWPDPNTNVLPTVEFTSAGPVIENANPVADIFFDGDPVAPYIRCAEDIPAGYYLVLVVDANGCYDLLPVHIPESNGLETSFEITSSDCQNGVSGCLTIEGGTPPYHIWIWVWNSPLTVIPTVQFDADGNPFIEGAESTDAIQFGPNNSTVNTRCAEDIPPGYYLVLTVDANGCYDLLPVLIPEVGNLEADFEITSPPCSDQVDGCLTVSGGTTPYNIWVWHWSDPTTDVLPNVHFDDNGNPQIDQAVPTDAISFEADPTTSSYITCAEDIPAGYYLVLVVDANGCYVLLPVIIPEPNSLGLHVLSRDVSCFGEADGVIKLTVLGGMPPYTIAINGASVSIADNAATAIFEDLAPGTYEITVVDANQCVGTTIVVINEPDPLDIELDYDPYGTYACAEPIGGTPPYQYRWFNLEANASIGNGPCVENLAAGVYMIVVQDDNDCQTAELLFIDEQPCLGGEATVDPELIQSGESTTFMLANYSGLSIQWQFKTEVTPWLNIPGATTDVYETPPINTGTDKTIRVRAAVTCQNGDVLYSAETEFKVEGSNLLVPYTALLEDPHLFDATFRQQEIRQLAKADNSSAMAVRVFPTLSSDVVYVQFEEQPEVPMMISLVNQLGQIVYQRKLDQIYESDRWEIPVHTLPDGIYFVHFSGLEQTQKVVVQSN